VAEENMALEAMRGELQGLMVFTSSMAYGLERVLGRGANAINFRAGRNVGIKTDVKATTDDPVKAIELVREELARHHINWEIRPWKPASSSSYLYDKDGQQAMKLSFHNCMVRCALFRFSHEQKLSLCQMEMGLLCGMLEKILGKRSQLFVLHAGENACLKELVIY
jgi:predicted hydrocarbon binding protein